MLWSTKFTDSLGSPYYEDDSILLYNVDCVEALSLLPQESIDLFITSPPYNIGKEYENIMDMDHYVEWCEKWLRNIPTALKPSGAFWLNIGYVKYKNHAKALPLTYLLWNKINMFLVQEIVWNYGAGVAGKTFLSPRNEKWLWYVKDSEKYTFNLDSIRDPDVKYPNQKKNGKLRCNTLGKNPSDVWQIAKVTSGTDRSSPERTAHPAQFPTDLIDRIVLGFSNENEIVLDPFMGSGSTAISALKHKRKVIGFEIRKDYCDMEVERILTYRNDQKILEAQQELWAVNGK